MDACNCFQQDGRTNQILCFQLSLAVSLYRSVCSEPIQGVTHPRYRANPLGPVQTSEQSAENGPPDRFQRTCPLGDFCLMVVHTIKQKSARTRYAVTWPRRRRGDVRGPGRSMLPRMRRITSTHARAFGRADMSGESYRRPNMSVGQASSGHVS